MDLHMRTNVLRKWNTDFNNELASSRQKPLMEIFEVKLIDYYIDSNICILTLTHCCVFLSQFKQNTSVWTS